MRKNPVLCFAIAMVMAVTVFFIQTEESLAESGSGTEPPESAWDLAPELNPGWNLGNSLEWQNLKALGFIPHDMDGLPEFQFVETRLNNPVTTKELIQSVADSGFRSIRIPVSFYHHLEESKPADDTGPNPGITVDKKWLERVKKVVDQALDAGLYVVINDHHDTGMYMNNSWIRADKDSIDLQLERFTNIWRQYAYYFKDYDQRLIFQSLGEVVNPERSFSSKDYRDFQMARELNQAFINTVRNTGSMNAHRFLILPTYASNADPIFVDQNFYSPYVDSASDKLLFSLHNYATDSKILEWSFNMLYKKAVRYGMPFVFTECGGKVKLGADKRAQVAGKLVEQAEKYGMAIFIWDDGDITSDGFGIVDRSATINDKTLRFSEGGDKIIAAMFSAKSKTKRMSPEELGRAAKEEYEIEAFTSLCDGNTSHLLTGMYSTIDANAFFPMSIYMPQPNHHAAIYPYIRTDTFDKLKFTLPEGFLVTIRELNEEGEFLRDAYASSPGRVYTPGEGTAMLAINMRNENTELNIGDYREKVLDGTLKIEANETKPLTGTVNLVSLQEGEQGKVALRWEANSRADSYRILRKEKGENEWKELSEISRERAEAAGNIYVDESAAPAANYYYTVRACRVTDKNITFAENYNKIGLEIKTKPQALPDPDPNPDPNPYPNPNPNPNPVPNTDHDSDSQKQTDKEGMPLGTGTSFAVADRVITSMESDSDPTGSHFAPLKFRSVKQGKKNLKLTWGKARGAAKYVIYGNRCNKGGKKYSMKRLATVKGKVKNIKNVAGSKIKKDTYYKFILVAVDRNERVVSVSKVIHVATKGGKVGNYRKITVKAVGNIRLKRGKTIKITTIPKASKKIKVRKHVGVRYESSNTKVVTVTKKGKIKGKKKGKCAIYCYAQNGLYKTVKVTVK